MKNRTLRTIGIASLIVVGFNLSNIGFATLSAGQIPRQTPSYPRPAPAPAPRSAPAPVERQAPTSASRPQPSPQPQRPSTPAPESHQTQQVQNQRTNQGGQQNQARPQQAQPRQQEEQARQQKQARESEQKQQEQKARELKQQQKMEEKKQKEQARQHQEAEKLQKKQGKTVTASVRPGALDPKGATGAASASGEHSAVSQLNAKRASMTGINHKPLPSGDVTSHANGSLTIKTSAGREYGVRANGTISSITENGRSANFNSRGKLTSARTSNISVRRGPHGERIVVSHLSGNTTAVSTGRRNGYIERSFQREGRTYVQRTVVLNSRIVTRTYVLYGYRGIPLPHFVSPVFYSPAFYGWVFYPWAVPVHYTWAWFAEPWYVGPHPYFVAYASYPSASLWLTDYYLGQTLSIAYHEQQDDFVDGANSDLSTDADISDDSGDIQASETTPVTAELKAAIADEVREQIAAENTAAASPDKAASYAELPSALTKTGYVFVVADGLDVTTEDQQGCTLQAGDTLQLVAPPSNALPLAHLRVASSKQLDCPAGSRVLVSLEDLQDMQNNFRIQIASGLATLQNKLGKDGLPSAPPEALSVPPLVSTGTMDGVSSAEAVSMLDSETHRADDLELEMSRSLNDGF